MLNVFSQTEVKLKERLVQLADERLSRKQKTVLVLINSNESNATNLVLRLSEELKCSDTSVWNTLKSLKRAGLIEYGSQKNKGVLVTLTATGEIISSHMRGYV